MLHAIERVPAERLAELAEFTFPLYRPLLRDAQAGPRLLGVAASSFGRPIGLALAEIRETDRRIADVLSISVSPLQRRGGVASALAARLEEEARAAGCLALTATYMTGQPFTHAVEALLRRRGFSAPARRMLVCEGDYASIIRAPWMARRELPPPYADFPWVSLTAPERADLEESNRRDPWFSELLTPFWREGDVEPVSSLGLRRAGEIVGWCITLREKRDTIRFSRLFVREGVPRALAVTLLARSILRHTGTEVDKAIFDVAAANTVMLRFVERRLAPFLLSMRWTQKARKLLVDAPGEGGA